MKGNLLQKGKMPEILRDYNLNFASAHGLQVTYGVAAKRFQAICKIFNNKWHPQETKGAYLSVFSVEAWKVLSQEEREKHTLKDCKACSEQFEALSDAFPTSVRRRKKPIEVPKKSKSVTIKLSDEDLSTPRALGQKVLKELNNISQERFHKSGEDVIIETPKSHLIRTPTSEELRKSKRKIEKNINNAIAQKKEEEASDIVMQNRLSWSTYDKLRKAEGLTTPKRPAQSSAQGEPSQKKRYVELANTVDKEKLLEVARSWSPDEDVNWSQLAREYCIKSPNGGQIFKEYLKENNIPAASIRQRTSRAQRRCKKRIGGTNLTIPMFPTAIHEKKRYKSV